MSITPHNALLALGVGAWGFFLVFGGAFGRRGATVTGLGIWVLTGAQLALAQVLPTALDVLTILLYLGGIGVWLRTRRGSPGAPGHRIDSAHNFDTSSGTSKKRKKED